MKKLLALIVAASFATVSAGSFAAGHSGGAPMKDKDAKMDCKDVKNKDHKDCKAAMKKDEMKK